MSLREFRSFNTVDKNKPSFTLLGRDVIRRDLLNRIMTRRGSRVMRPTYGTNIYDLVFEPLDDMTRTVINDEIVDAIGSDPRIRIISVDINETEKAITLSISIEYLSDYTPDMLYAEFTREEI